MRLVAGRRPTGIPRLCHGTLPPSGDGKHPARTAIANALRTCSGAIRRGHAVRQQRDRGGVTRTARPVQDVARPDADHGGRARRDLPTLVGMCTWARIDPASGMGRPRADPDRFAANAWRRAHGAGRPPTPPLRSRAARRGAATAALRRRAPPQGPNVHADQAVVPTEKGRATASAPSPGPERAPCKHGSRPQVL